MAVYSLSKSVSNFCACRPMPPPSPDDGWPLLLRRHRNIVREPVVRGRGLFCYRHRRYATQQHTTLVTPAPALTAVNAPLTCLS
jgi:hypothetical protein